MIRSLKKSCTREDAAGVRTRALRVQKAQVPEDAGKKGVAGSAGSSYYRTCSVIECSMRVIPDRNLDMISGAAKTISVPAPNRAAALATVSLNKCGWRRQKRIRTMIEALLP